MTALKNQFRMIFSVRSTWYYFIAMFALVALPAIMSGALANHPDGIYQLGAGRFLIPFICTFATVNIIGREYRAKTFGWLYQSSNKREGMLLSRTLIITLMSVLTVGVGILLALAFHPVVAGQTQILSPGDSFFGAPIWACLLSSVLYSAWTALLVEITASVTVPLLIMIGAFLVEFISLMTHLPNFLAHLIQLFPFMGSLGVFQQENNPNLANPTAIIIFDIVVTVVLAAVAAVQVRRRSVR